MLILRGQPLWPPAVPRLAARPSQSNPRGSGPEVLKRERGHVTSETRVADVAVFGALQRNVLLLKNLVIVFVHWVSTGVLYEPRQCSLFWNYIPESKLCFCVNLCRPPGPYSIRPVQKLLNCQTTTRGASGCCSIHPDQGATKNTAVALSSRNDMISIQSSLQPYIRAFHQNVHLSLKFS